MSNTSILHHADGHTKSFPLKKTLNHFCKRKYQIISVYKREGCDAVSFIWHTEIGIIIAKFYSKLQNAFLP